MTGPVLFLISLLANALVLIAIYRLVRSIWSDMVLFGAGLIDKSDLGN